MTAAIIAFFACVLVLVLCYRPMGARSATTRNASYAIATLASCGAIIAIGLGVSAQIKIDSERSAAESQRFSAAMGRVADSCPDDIEHKGLDAVGDEFVDGSIADAEARAAEFVATCK